MPIINTSKTFSGAKSAILNAIPLEPIVCGVPESVLSGISNRYILELTADLGGFILGFGTGKHEITIHAYLQDKITLNSSSSWDSIAQDIPGADMLKKLDTAVQALTGLTAITTVSTQRKWTGSAPISMTFKLKFEAVNDVNKEVLEPCQLLQGLTLPREALGNNIVGLIPPGPSPYTLQQAGDNSILSRGEQISINIGGFIKFTSVIVKSVTVVYENRMGVSGPIGASVDLTIETWRMLTREDMKKAYDEKMSVSTTNAIGKVG